MIEKEETIEELVERLDLRRIDPNVEPEEWGVWISRLRDALRAKDEEIARLRERFDALHDQRHEEARNGDHARAENARLTRRYQALREFIRDCIDYGYVRDKAGDLLAKHDEEDLEDPPIGRGKAK